MNRRILAATLGFCLLAGGVAAIPRLVDEAATRNALIGEVEAATGARLSLPTHGQFTFVPWPTFLYENARLASSDGTVSAEMKAVRVTLTPFAAWFGGAALSVEVDGVTARVATHGAWQPFRFDRARLQRIRPFALGITKGIITVDAPTGSLFGATERARVEIPSARLGWARESVAATGAISAVWNGRMVDLALSAPSPTRLVQGETEALTLSGSVDGGDAVSFDGTLSVRDTPALDGTFELSLENPLTTLAWLGETRLLPRLPALSLSGTLATTARGWSLSRLKGALGDAMADGGLSISMAQGRPLVQGTLAFDQIDLTPDRRDALALAIANDLLIEPITPTLLTVADIDVLLSTNRLRLPGATLNTVSGALILREGRLRVEVSDGELGGGRADGHIEMRAADGGFAARGRLALKEVRIGEFVTATPPLGINDAIMNFSVEANTRGASPAGLLSALAGRCEGDLTRLDHAAVSGLPGLGTGEPFVGALDQPAARPIRFDRIRMACDIRDGAATVSKLEAKVGETSATLAGRFAWDEALFDMTGTLTANKTTAPTPISLSGRWSSPLVTPLAPPGVN